jgi:hypothetical protein
MTTVRAEAVHNPDEPWFDEIREIDAEWVEVKVTTSKGEIVYYRIPRRTLFPNIDVGTRAEAA